MPEQRGNWFWNVWRKKSRKELDRLEKGLVIPPAEKRKFAGDPAQAPHMRVPTRNK
jgi:hypothetical protein